MATATAVRNGRQWRTPAPRIAAPDKTANERRERVLEIREGVDAEIGKWDKAIRDVATIQRTITASKNIVAAHEAGMAAMRVGFTLAAEGSNQKARDADALRLQNESEAYEYAAAELEVERGNLENWNISLEATRAAISLHRARISAYTAEYKVLGEL